MTQSQSRSLPVSTDLVVAASWGLLVLLLLAVPPFADSPIRTVAAGSFLLVVPGYLIVAVLFPRDAQLSLLERGVFSVGASLAYGGLIAIPVSATSWGVQLWTLGLTQALVLGALGVVVEFRRGRLPAGERARPLASLRARLDGHWNNRNAVGGGNRAVQVAIGIAVLGLVVATVYTVATPLPSERYTELDVLDTDGTIEGLPESVTGGETVELLVGVTNNEFAEQRYGLQLQSVADGGSPTVLETDGATVAHEDTWQTTRTVTVPDGVDTLTIQVLLFEGQAPGTPVAADQAYRDARLVLEVREDTTASVLGPGSHAGGDQ